MEVVMPQCISEGCDRETRMRPFKGSKKLYPESRCGVCMNLYKKYKLTGPERDEMLKTQGFTCKICSGEIAPKTHGHTSRDAAVVDHCHDTNALRGILCGQCNVGLGAFIDSPNLLRLAADYIEKTRITDSDDS